MRPVLPLLLLATLVCAADPLYVQDFDQAEAVPEDLMLNGEFSLQADGAGKSLALPPQVLETYNLLFGPGRKEAASVSARILGTAKGRQAPAFGVGLNGVNGIILRLSPAKNQVELLVGDTAIASQAYAWKSDVWTCFRLRWRMQDGTCLAEGRVWAAGTAEPEAWTITATMEQAPPAGRATAWGIPYGGKPILFDDLRVEVVP